MQIIDKYLKYVGEERGWWDNEIIEVTTEGNKESQVVEFLQKVRNFYGKDIEDTFSKAYLYWKGIQFEQPFGNLLIYNIDEIFKATEKIHDVFQTLSERRKSNTNYDFLCI